MEASNGMPNSVPFGTRDDSTLAEATAELYRMATGEDLEPGTRAALSYLLTRAPDGRWAEQVVHGTQQLLAARAFVGLFLLGEDVLWSFYRMGTLFDVFKRTVAAIDSSPPLRAEVARFCRANGAQRIEMRSGRRLLFVRRDAGRGARGISVDCHLLDEHLSDRRSSEDPIRSALLNTASRPNAQVVVAP